METMWTLYEIREQKTKTGRMMMAEVRAFEQKMDADLVQIGFLGS